MITKDAYIVFQNTQNGPYPVIIELTQELAYEYISRVTAGKQVLQNEWSIYKTQIHLPQRNRVVAGELDVNIPAHVLSD